jgi:[citrate (pro-3S)-lyase] ligase
LQAFFASPAPLCTALGKPAHLLGDAQVISKLTSPSELAAAKNLVVRNGLSFEPSFDELRGLYEQGELVAVGARAGKILKMLAIAPSHQGSSVLAEIVSSLVSSGIEAGIESFFVFTKPEYVTSFEALHFTLLATQEKAALLEYGRGLRHWLESKRSLIRPGVNGAAVMNCNPFSLGHRYLVESASHQVDNLYVFVVREDRSCFPFDTRFRLVRAGICDIGNTVLLDTSDYIISGATFPTYFLKRDDEVARIQMELDVSLFASQIAPFLGITRRFVGTEPRCELTNSYNGVMKRLLPLHGIELIEIERKQAPEGVISASKVRGLLARNELSKLKDYVPASTLAFLLSAEAEPIRTHLQQDQSR